MIKQNNEIPQIVSINISKGGIPKLPTDSIYIKKTGLEGDGHNHAKHYRPEQAVCLQDLEMLEELSQEGYPLKPGTTGENITTINLKVNNLPLGTILEFDGGLVLEISKVRKPCYVLDSINPKLKEDIIGRCGMYARVIEEGAVKTGQTIQLRIPSISSENSK